MSKNTLVTTSQTESIRKMANEKKVGRAKLQEALDDGRVSRFLDDLKAGAVVVASLRNLNIPLTTHAKPECTVANCFTDKKIFAYRDADFDNWLPATLPASREVSVSGRELTEVTTEAKMAKVGKPFTNLLQIEDLILRTEKMEETDLITNGYANIFFLKVGASVFTVGANRNFGIWRVYIHRFYPWYEWIGGARFFSPAT